jgi:poly(A) polymerase
MQAPAHLPSLADAPWLTAAPTQRVLAAIAAGGFEARCVGGVVRNALMGLAVTDIDIATTALPEDVIRLARAAGLGVAETGLQHGTVTVIADHHPFEVTTLRRDVETRGRHATVAFTDDWSADARRRDFTMNALYCDAAGRVYDPLAGYSDLAARRVRFIGDPANRIAEDYLRILRFFRFTAQYSTGAPDAEGLRACTRMRDGLAMLSKERIHQELTRLLAARAVQAAIVSMRDHGILAQVLPAAPRPGLLARIIAIERDHGLEPDSMLRLAALAVETPEDAVRIGAAFKLSRAERGVLDLSPRAHAHLSAPLPPPAARALLYQEGPDRYLRLVALSWARALHATTTSAEWSDALALPGLWSAPRLPVSGADVMARGIASGPAVGDTLRALEAWWIERDFEPDRDALLRRLPSP